MVEPTVSALRHRPSRRQALPVSTVVRPRISERTRARCRRRAARQRRRAAGRPACRHSRGEGPRWRRRSGFHRSIPAFVALWRVSGHVDEAAAHSPHHVLVLGDQCEPAAMEVGVAAVEAQAAAIPTVSQPSADGLRRSPFVTATAAGFGARSRRRTHTRRLSPIAAG